MITNEPLRTPEALHGALLDAGFPDTARRLEAAARPCVRLAGVRRPGGRVISRLGGCPDLPPSLRWPAPGGQALSFVAQIVLDEIPTAGSLGLPDRGVLYFFYEDRQFVWGFRPDDQWGFAVLYAPETPIAPRPAPFPASLPEKARFKGMALAPFPAISYPAPGTGLDLAWGAESANDRVDHLFQRYAPLPGPHHQLRGRPSIIQIDMEVDVQFATHGIDCGGWEPLDTPRCKALEAGASEWSLLLQIDSDPRTGMMWGDLGRLYYWIHEADLRARQFDHAWLILQCS